MLSGIWLQLGKWVTPSFASGCICWCERSSRQSIFAKLKEEGVFPTRHILVRVHQSCTANMDLSWIHNFGISVRVSWFRYQCGLNQILLKCPCGSPDLPVMCSGTSVTYSETKSFKAISPAMPLPWCSWKTGKFSCSWTSCLERSPKASQPNSIRQDTGNCEIQRVFVWFWRGGAQIDSRVWWNMEAHGRLLAIYRLRVTGSNSGVEQDDL